MTNNAQFTVSSMRKTENYDLNGGHTVRQGLAVFYRCSEREVANNVTGQSIRLNSTTLSTAELDQALRAGDVITIFPANIERGGVKGA